MKISLHSPVRKTAVLAAAMVVSLLYFAETARELTASWLGGRVQLKSLQYAARLDPSSADYRDHLGRYYALIARDPATAVGYYRSAVQLNPHSAGYWFDLASAYQILGDVANQTAALERAIEADPMTPDVAWQAANLYLVQGQNAKALREFSVVMANDASLAYVSIRLCWRLDPNVDSLLRDVVPHTAEANLALLQLLETQPDDLGTSKVWNALVDTHQHFSLEDLREYIQYLIKHKEVDEAVTAWQKAVLEFGLASYQPSAKNLVVNPRFSLEVLDAGFDWQYSKQTSVTLTLDPSDFHAGRRSLLIAFDGPGISDAGIFQLIPVQPNTAYDFSAYYKNGELMEGAGGPHLTIQDMYTQAIYYDSDELKDAGGFWKSLDGEFTTPPDCKLVVLHVRRIPEGSPIRGKLWVDDFRLTPKPS
jgi:tetratricopeptide (TPR) repeat protein